MRRALLLIPALSLAGCGINPLVTWDKAPELEGRPVSMETAVRHAESIKTAIRSKAYTQVGTQVTLNDSLLGLGILSMGIAASTAHKDAYLIPAFIGGAGYLYGTKNLQKSVLATYQSGIGAVNCAIEAVRPLQVDPSTLADVASQSDALAARQAALASLLLQAEILFAAERAQLPSDQIDIIVAQLDKARTALSFATETRADAKALPGRIHTAAGQLKFTAENIGDQVNKLVADNVTDTSAIPAMINSLAQLVGMQVPGTKTTELLNARLAARGKATDGAAKSDNGKGGTTPAPHAPSAALERTMLAVAGARVQLEFITVALDRQLAPTRGHNSSEALKACGVSDAGTELRVDTEAIEFTLGADDTQVRRITVSGGTKPYVARFRESPTNGVEVISPLPQDNVVEVRAPKDVTKAVSLTLVVVDSAQTSRTRTITVKVVPARADQDKKEAPTASAELKKAVDGLAKMKDKGDSFRVNAGGNSYKISGTRLTGEDVGIILACTQAANATDPAIKVVEAMVKAAFDKKYIDSMPSDAVKQKLQGGLSDDSADKKCIAYS